METMHNNKQSNTSMTEEAVHQFKFINIIQTFPAVRGMLVTVKMTVYETLPHFLQQCADSWHSESAIDWYRVSRLCHKLLNVHILFKSVYIFLHICASHLLTASSTHDAMRLPDSLLFLFTRSWSSEIIYHKRQSDVSMTEEAVGRYIQVKTF